MGNRKKSVEKPTDAFAALRREADIPAAPRDPVVQASIDHLGDKADYLPDATTFDMSNVGREMAQADAAAAVAAAEAHDEAEFLKQYEHAKTRSVGYLQARRMSGNRTAMVPPNCEIHPKLGMWGLRYAGKWLIIRWLDIRPRTRQKRSVQGWQYFEGEEWCKRLGLLKEAYYNDRGRIGYIDVELAWAPEEYIFAHETEVREAREAMIATTTDRLMSHKSKHVPNIDILEGDDESVIGELRDRKRFAESRS